MNRLIVVLKLNSLLLAMALVSGCEVSSLIPNFRATPYPTCTP